MQTGIEQAILSKYENGSRMPTTENLIILADFFNVSIDYLLCRTEVREVNGGGAGEMNLPFDENS